MILLLIPFFLLLNLKLINGQIPSEQPFYLTNGHDQIKDIQIHTLAQCRANNGTDKSTKTPYTIEFRLPREDGNCDDGLLICYPPFLRRGKHLNKTFTFKVKRAFAIDDEKGNSIDKQCAEQMAKHGHKNGTHAHWRGIKLRTVPMSSSVDAGNGTELSRFTIELEASIASGHIINLGENVLNISIHLGGIGNNSFFTRIYSAENEMPLFLADQFRYEFFLKYHLSNGGAFLSDYASLWLLGLDMLPMAHQQQKQTKMNLFVSRGCECNMEAWFIQPSVPVVPSDSKMPSAGSVSCPPKQCKANLTEEEYERLFPVHFDKYIFASWKGICGGLGNQMWRFASLYGIGRPYGRKPISKMGQECKANKGGDETEKAHESERAHELEELFPVYDSQIKFINATEKANDTFYQKGFAPLCCTYVDPEKYGMSRIKEKYLEIEGFYFQSYKFFASRRMEIRQIFQIGQKLCKSVEIYKKVLFSNDQSHKFCVHTRLGDFKKLGWQTKNDFTEQGIEFGFNYLKEKFVKDITISVILMGEDKEFLNNLTFNRQLFAKVYVPKPMPRSNDFAFAILACNSLLITAQTFTFSWWMAYLMPDNATIFYNFKFDKKYPHTRENFLPEWIPICLTNGTMALA